MLAQKQPVKFANHQSPIVNQNESRSMRPVLRASLMLSLFLAIPIIPFLVLGESFEQDVQRWLVQEQETASRIQFALVAGILASDIFLPIPASAVITFAGGEMGLWPATFWSWIGMNIGACLGFGLSKWLGKPFARRFAEPEDLERIERVSEKLGAVVLLATRPLPILAEACVLLIGTTSLSWRR
ncbi:MAG: VTT domain-containing protein, partial [Planctomycetota bacterium]|nr:VTT domain-containing protein [Planctomycetota bacterium]